MGQSHESHVSHRSHLCLRPSAISFEHEDETEFLRPISPAAPAANPLGLSRPILAPVTPLQGCRGTQ